jgi:hypothetical protein
MPSSITFALLKQRARERADQINSNFVTDDELGSLVNRSYYTLYDLLTTLYGNDYFVSGPFSIASDGVSSSYPLPPDFYKLLGVDLVLGGSNNLTLKPFNFSERNKYSNFVSHLYGHHLRYRLSGNNLIFSPKPEGGKNFNLWYIAQPVDLVADTDTLTGVLSQFCDYIIVDSAIKMLVKQESDTSQLAAEKAEIMQRIQIAGQDRDAGMPSTVSDTSRYGWLI